MAIDRTPNTRGLEELPLYFNNGDLAALREALNRLGFRDEESAIRYMIAVLSRSATRSVSVIDRNGVKADLTPSDTLLAGTPTPAQS